MRRVSEHGPAAGMGSQLPAGTSGPGFSFLGWFDGNPAYLWEDPPVEQAKRYVADDGGVDAVVAKARGYLDAGDREQRQCERC